MAKFTYEAMNSVGQPVKGEVDAVTSDDAIAKVRAMGNFPTKIKEKAAGGGARKQAGGPRGQAAAAAQAGPQKRQTVGGVSRKLLTQFTRQLSTLINAGLPILRSLRILEQQQKPGMLRVAIRLIAEDVEGGSTLSESMARHPKAFDRLYVNMVRAGEIGGVLDVILQRLADFMEKAQALRRKVVGAMIYPIVVVVFAVAIMMGIMMFVIPSFANIFSDMGAELPAITRGLMATSNWIKDDFGWLVILSVPVAIFLLFRLIRMSPAGAFHADKFKLAIPIFGQIASKTSIARFSRTLGTLLTAGVPILEAIQITANTSGNEVYARALTNVHDGIREGESFAGPLRQAKIVDPMVVNMIDVGEETGELDQMLNKIADTYDDEVETLVAGMVSLLEPIMVIVLGGIVGTIVLALFLPMVALMETLQ
jgi:type IV pilus assembly protein PilC